MQRSKTRTVFLLAAALPLAAAAGDVEWPNGAQVAVSLSYDDWRALAERGHELGNHTIYHPCSAVGPDRGRVEPWNDLDTIGIPRLRREIMIANTCLQAVDGETRRTCAATCYDPLAGADLIRFVTDNTADGRLLGIVFHGVGGDHLSVTPAAHRELADFLAAHPDVYWVDTYRNIIGVVREQLEPAKGE